MKNVVLGLLLVALAIPSAPAIAKQDRGWSKEQRDSDRRSHGNPDRGRPDNHDGRAREDRSDHRHSDRGRHLGHQKRAAWRDFNRYDFNRFEPRYGNYQANRYYRDGDYYRDRRLNNSDRIYRGSNGRYYCRRSDGTTGLILGAAGGSLLGRAIAPNRSKTLGTILGGVGGALIGRSIGRDGVRCN